MTSTANITAAYDQADVPGIHVHIDAGMARVDLALIGTQSHVDEELGEEA